MKIAVICVCALAVSTNGFSIDFNSVNRGTRSADDAGELKSKLTKLQSLLKDIRLEEGILRASIGSTDENDHIPQTGQSKESVKEQGKTETGEAPNMKIKKFVESMTPRDVETLRELKQMLASARESRPDLRAENPGTFTDDVVDDSDEGVNKYSWQDLVRQLQSKKENYNPLEKAKDESLTDDQASVQSEEGAFGAFRDEIKEAVEKNLLSDIALAIHSGISFEEIIRDLTEPESSQKGDSGWWKRG